jgi:hypothetical protein
VVRGSLAPLRPDRPVVVWPRLRAGARLAELIIPLAVDPPVRGAGQAGQYP